MGRKYIQFKLVDNNKFNFNARYINNKLNILKKLLDQIKN